MATGGIANARLMTDQEIEADPNLFETYYAAIALTGLHHSLYIRDSGSIVMVGAGRRITVGTISTKTNAGKHRWTNGECNVMSAVRPKGFWAGCTPNEEKKPKSASTVAFLKWLEATRTLDPYTIRRRTNAYYHAHKDTPEFKERCRQAQIRTRAAMAKEDRQAMDKKHREATTMFKDAAKRKAYYNKRYAEIYANDPEFLERTRIRMNAYYHENNEAVKARWHAKMRDPERRRKQNERQRLNYAKRKFKKVLEKYGGDMERAIMEL